MQRTKSTFALALVLLVFPGCVNALGEPGLETESGASEGKAIVGGVEVEQCGFATTVSLGGCTGTLIHPQVILTAAHCGQPRVAEMTSLAGQGIRRRIHCEAVPQNGGRASDTMFCLLEEPFGDVPVTPVLMGCELDALTVGTDVSIVGFGLTAFDQRGSGGVKRWTTTEIVGFEPGVALIGTPERSACPGDSGGPVFVRLADGGLRVFGNVSGGTTGIPCNGRGAYPITAQHVPWVEATFGIDVSPCHDADGTWNPGPDCGGFYAGSHIGYGTFDNACAGTPTTGLSATCGAPFSQDFPGDGVPEQCASVPASYVGVGDGCDCPADGTLSCDPDCQVSNGGGQPCGCDYCYGEPPPPPPPMCDAIPATYLGVNDGCDCPADGATSCDPDCALGNIRPPSQRGSCGCDYCY